MSPCSPTPPPNDPFGFSVPLAPISRWIPALAPGGLTFADGDSPLVKPYTADDSTRVIIERPAGLAGTTVRVRLGYIELDPPEPPESPMRVSMFGRAHADDPWSVMRNLLNQTIVEIATSDGDVWHGDNKAFATPRPTTTPTPGTATGTSTS